MKRPVILLVNPWIHDFAAYDLWARPLGLLVLATRLRRCGWEPRLVDCLDRDHPEMGPIKAKAFSHGHLHRTSIPKPGALEGVPRTYCRYGVHPEFIKKDLESMPVPRAILVTSLMTYWYPGVQEAIQLLRAIFPQAPILLGGIYASLLPEHARERCGAGEVLVGPGERALGQALYRKTGVGVSPDEDPAELEFSPCLDLMRHVRFLPLLTSRGCPFNCAYCASRIMSPAFVRRNPAVVIEEIEATAIRYGVQDIALYDDAFLVDPARHALPILEAAAKRVPGMRWHTPNGLHASAIDRSVASAMKRAGFETIRLGLESSSDEFHARTGGKTDIQSFLKAVANLKEAGFSREQIGAYLLVGLPGQSKAVIEDDAERVLLAGAFPKLAEYSPIPGTEIWSKAVKASRYPIDKEPLFQNCTLLPAAEPGVDAAFLQATRKRISEYADSSI
ncbi:MAG: B12-binding domain-containing radical SAM protein [Desulfomonilaceae bacterium]